MLDLPIRRQIQKNSYYTKFDWLDIFTEPIKFRVTSRICIDVIMKKVYSIVWILPESIDLPGWKI